MKRTITRAIVAFAAIALLVVLAACAPSWAAAANTNNAAQAVVEDIATPATSSTTSSQGQPAGSKDEGPTATKAVQDALDTVEKKTGVELYGAIHASDEQLALGTLETIEANDPNGLFASTSDVLDTISIDRTKIAENTKAAGCADYVHIPYGTDDESAIQKMDQDQIMRNLTWHIMVAEGVLRTPVQYGSSTTFADLDSMSWLKEDVTFWKDIQSDRKETFVINDVRYEDATGLNRCVFVADEDGAICIRPTVRWRMLRLAYFLQGAQPFGFYAGRTVWNYHASHGNDPSKTFATLNEEQYTGNFHVYKLQLKGLAQPALFFFNVNDRRLAYVVKEEKKEEKTTTTTTTSGGGGENVVVVNNNNYNRTTETETVYERQNNNRTTTTTTTVVVVDENEEKKKEEEDSSKHMGDDRVQRDESSQGDGQTPKEDGSGPIESDVTTNRQRAEDQTVTAPTTTTSSGEAPAQVVNGTENRDTSGYDAGSANNHYQVTTTSGSGNEVTTSTTSSGGAAADAGSDWKSTMGDF